MIAQGKKDVIEAVLIALFTAIATKVVDLAAEAVERRRKRRAKKTVTETKEKKPCADSTSPS